MEMNDNTAFRGMVGFMGTANLEPLRLSQPTASPKLSRLMGLEVTDHGQAVGAYIQGALGEEVLGPTRLQNNPRAQQKYIADLYERTDLSVEELQEGGLDQEVTAVLRSLETKVAGLSRASLPPTVPLADRLASRRKTGELGQPASTPKPGPKAG